MAGLHTYPETFPNNQFVTNLDDTAFAALLLTIVHKEGRLDGNQKPNTWEEWVSDEGADVATLAGKYDGTIGIANIRPSVAREILEGEIRGPNGDVIGTGCYPIRNTGYYKFMKDNPDGIDSDWPLVGAGDLFIGFAPVMEWRTLLARELQDETMAIEYLAANMRRGADRARLLNAEPSAMNLAAYHRGGIQTPGLQGYDAVSQDGIPIGYNAVDYGYQVVKQMPELLLFVSQVPGATYGAHYLDFNIDDADAARKHLGVEP